MYLSYMYMYDALQMILYSIMLPHRVLDILTYWMKKCWPDFYRSEVLVSLHFQDWQVVCKHILSYYY